MYFELLWLTFPNQKIAFQHNTDTTFHILEPDVEEINKAKACTSAWSRFGLLFQQPGWFHSYLVGFISLPLLFLIFFLLGFLSSLSLFWCALPEGKDCDPVW